MRMENYQPDLPRAIPREVNREIEKVCREARHIIVVNQQGTVAWADDREKNWNEIGVDVEEIVRRRWAPSKDKLGLGFVFADVNAAVDFVMHRLRLEADLLPELSNEAQMQICWCFAKRWGAYNVAYYTSLNKETVLKVANDNVGFLNLVTAHRREMRGTYDEITAELHEHLRDLWQFWIDNRDQLPQQYPLDKHIPLFPSTVEEVLDVLNAE